MLFIYNQWLQWIDSSGLIQEIIVEYIAIYIVNI